MITWKDDPNKYSTGTVAMLGDFEVGGVYYDGSTKGDKYFWTCKLPGFRTRSLVHFKTEEEAKEYLSGVIDRWIKRAGLQEAE